MKEYFPGDTITNFDYGAEYSSQYYNTPSNGKHKPGKLISMKAAKRFCEEVIYLYLYLTKNGYLVHRYNSDSIIIRYDEKKDKIEWKYTDYLFTEKSQFNSDNLRWALHMFQNMLGWRICTYTNYSKFDEGKSHPFWISFNSLLKEKVEHYQKIGENEYKRYLQEGRGWQQNWPLLPSEEVISTIELVYNQCKCFC